MSLPSSVRLSEVDPLSLRAMPWRTAASTPATTGAVVAAAAAAAPPAPPASPSTPSLRFFPIEAFVTSCATRTSAPPEWLGLVPLSVRIDVVKGGAEADLFDAEDGLWSLVPSTVPPPTLPDGRPNSDAVAEYDGLTDAVATLPQSLDSALTRERLWQGLWRTLEQRKASAELRAAAAAAAAADTSAKKTTNAALPPEDYCLSTTNIGKDPKRCTIAVEHPSASRVHAQVGVGVVASSAAALTTSEVASTLGVYLVDLGSANGTLVSRANRQAAGTMTSGVTMAFERLAPHHPVLLAPGGAGTTLFRIGASSRNYSVSWLPLQGQRAAATQLHAAGDEDRQVGVKSTTRELAQEAALAHESSREAPGVRGAALLQPLHSSNDAYETSTSAVDDVGGPSAFASAAVLQGESIERLSARRRRIEDAIEQLMQATQEKDGASGGAVSGAVGGDARMADRFASLEKDLLAVKVAISRAAAAARGQASNRRVVKEVA